MFGCVCTRNTCVKCGSGKWQAVINQTGNQFRLALSRSLSVPHTIAISAVRGR